MRASISVPAFFQPVTRGTQLLADGGLSNPVPVDVAARLCKGPVIASQLSGGIETEDEVLTENRKTTMLSVTIRSLSIIQRQLTLAHYRTYPPDLLIASTVGNVRLHEFYKASYCIEQGHYAAAEAMDKPVVNPKKAR